MPRVLQTALADQDVTEIGRFIVHRSGDLQTALRFLERIDERCQQHARQPEMGEVVAPEFGASVRRFTVDSFLVCYRIVEDGIVVLAIARANRQLDRMLKERLRDTPYGHGSADTL